MRLDPSDRRRSGSPNYRRLLADEINGQFGQLIVMTFRIAILDYEILALDVAGFAQALFERGYPRRHSRS
jgi:hypothetical protein